MHFHFSHYTHLFNRELDELYISMAIRSFALSIVGIFVPIYLLDIGYSVTDVFLYYAVFLATRFLFAAPAAKLATQHGLKKMMFISTVMLTAYFVLLRFAPDYNIGIYFLGVLCGIALTIFWTSYHMDFIKSCKKKYIGEEISIVNIITAMFSFFGPLLGGVAILLFGFDSVFIASSAILAISMIPLFLSKDSHKPYPFSLKMAFRNTSIKDYIANIGYGMEIYASTIWIMMIFIFFTNSIEYVGLIISLSLLFSLLASYTAGRYSNNFPRNVLKISSMATAFIWLIKSFLQNAFQVVIADSIHGITRTSQGVSFDALTYRKTRKNAVEYIMFREAMIGFGGMLLMLLLILFNNLTANLYLAALGSVLAMVF